MRRWLATITIAVLCVGRVTADVTITMATSVEGPMTALAGGGNMSPENRHADQGRQVAHGSRPGRSERCDAHRPRNQAGDHVAARRQDRDRARWGGARRRETPDPAAEGRYHGQADREEARDRHSPVRRVHGRDVDGHGIDGGGRHAAGRRRHAQGRAHDGDRLPLGGEGRPRQRGVPGVSDQCLEAGHLRPVRRFARHALGHRTDAHRLQGRAGHSLSQRAHDERRRQRRDGRDDEEDRGR